MPAKAEFKVQDWVADLLKDQAIPEDRRKVVEEVLTAEAIAGRIREGVLRQQDYSRQTQELAEQRRQVETGLQQAQQKYQESYGGLAKWREDQLKIVEQWKTELAEVKAREERLAGAVARAKAQGLEDKDLGLDGDPARTAHRTEPAQPKYVTAEELEAERARIGKTMGDFTPGLMNILQQHNALFPGQSLDMVALVDGARRQAKSVEEVWAEQYKVPDRIHEIQKEALDKQLRESREAGLKEGREAALRELSTGQVVPGTPGGRPVVLGPAFHVADVKAQMAPTDGVTHTGNPVMDAVEAYRTGKHAAKPAA